MVQAQTWRTILPKEKLSMDSQRYLLVVNPHSGNKCGASVLEKVQSVFRSQNIDSEVRITERAEHARQIARETCLDGFTGICSIGGDGTFHEVASGIVEREQETPIPVGIIPGGTGNDVTRHLGIRDADDGIHRILTGRTQPFDVAEVTAADQIDYCTTLVGWNAVAEVNRIAEELRIIGPPRYAIAGLFQVVLSRQRRATVILDDHTIEDEFLLVTACNTSFVGSGMRLAPMAKTDDGKIDVVVVRKATRWQLLSLFRKIYDGSHLEADCVEYFQTCSLQIVADDGLALDIDGEVKGSVPVSIDVIPGAIQVFG